MTTRVRAADHLVSYLHRVGVRTCYSLSGTGSIYLDEAFAAHPGIEWVCARHETAAALMATGSAKLTGELGVALVTSGPGAINALAGLADAYADGVPVLIVSGQVETHHIDDEVRSFGLQGLGVVSAVRSLTKYAALVTDPADLDAQLETAVHKALTGRPGPVWLDIPLDVQAAPLTVRPGPAGAAPTGRRDDCDPVPQAAALILDVLRRSARPLIVAGQGIRQAGAVDAFRALVAQLHVPVITSRLGIDLLGFGGPYCLGQGGIRGRECSGLVMAEADAVVSLGSSLSIGFVGEDADAFAPGTTVVAVDIDPSQLKKKGVHLDHHVCADVADVIAELRRIAGPVDRPQWLARCTGLKTSHPTTRDAVLSEPFNTYEFVRLLDRLTGPTDVFAVDTGSAFYVSGQTLQFDAGQREVTSAALVNMGAAVPMAIGAAFAHPDHQVLVLVGDGAIELNVQELATISQYRLNTKVFVLNNGGYASIRESQEALCDGAALAEPESLDFRSVARAFRLPYRRLERAATVEAEARALLAAPGPVLVEVMCDPGLRLVRPLRPDGQRQAHDGASLPAADSAAGTTDV